MLFIDLIVWSVFIGLCYFIFYRFIIITSSYRGKIIDIKKREYLSKFLQRFTVVIYSHNNSQKVKKLLDLLAKQNYEKEKYSVNVILDNCDPENIKLLEICGGARLWRINTDINPIGRYKAFAWLLERIRTSENTNAFILLDADSIIKSDFLDKVNSNLTGEYVLAGETIKRKNFLTNQLINLKSRINNRVIRHGRFYSSLGNIIDTDVLVIKQDILERIEFETTDGGFEEYEYAIKLKYFDIPVVYSGEISVHKNVVETYKSIAVKEYQKRYKAFKTFINNYQFIFSKKGAGFSELIISLAYPSSFVFYFWVFVLGYVSAVYTGTYFSKILGLNAVSGLVAAKLVSDFYSMINIRCNFKDYYHALILCAYNPLIYIWSVLVGFMPANKSNNKEEKDIPIPLTYSKEIFEATITNGKKEFPCKLEITKSNENAQATFIFNDKKLTSTRQPRVDFAVDEIIQKLKANGFSLKVCSNCGYFYFTESTAAHTDGEQGYCLYKNFKQASREKFFSKLCNTCPNIIPSQARNYILQELGVEKTPSRR